MSITSESHTASTQPNKEQIRRWRRYLAEERQEADTYRALARQRQGIDGEILMRLSEAEARHEQHWLSLLGPHAFPAPRIPLRSRLLSTLAKAFGSVFVLAMAQRSEQRSAYDMDQDATSAMAADEHLHSEVIRALASASRSRMSGTFRAAVFGANDGLVSNLALVMGIAAAASTPQIILFTGITGLLAGALSMAAGEYVSVKSQTELLAATQPDDSLDVSELDQQANELKLLYMARGEDEDIAEAHAQRILKDISEAQSVSDDPKKAGVNQLVEHLEEKNFVEVGTAPKAAASSFLFFAFGAIIPCLPYIFGLSGPTAMVIACILVGIALLVTGGIVGVLSGASPAPRALRQLAIGYAAAAVTYLLGTLSSSLLA
ncbi:MAG: VIT1/CCC1 family protein [Actinomycetaceae bacterium]|nr:VIT1/CCC1 family protein [Actinomycetaceae bacterium]